jgi:hypothetical protein
MVRQTPTGSEVEQLIGTALSRCKRKYHQTAGAKQAYPEPFPVLALLRHPAKA